MIDFSSNVNAVVPYKNMAEFLKKYTDLVFQYPDHTNEDTKILLCSLLGIPIKNIELGIGSTQILFDIPRFITYSRAVIPTPTFWQYTHFNELAGKKILKIPMTERDNFSLDYSLLDRSVSPGDAVFLCNVNSPTSVLFDEQQLKRIFSRHPDVTFIIDETYLLFRKDFEKRSLMKYATRHENVMVIVSLSKFFALPGLRVGILIASKKITELYTRNFHIPYSINGFVPIALRYLIQKKNVEITRAYYADEKDRLFDLLQEKLNHELKCFKPEGNFILCKLRGDKSGLWVKQKLKQRGLIVRGGGELRDVEENWLRLSILKRHENDLLVRELIDILR